MMSQTDTRVHFKSFTLIEIKRIRIIVTTIDHIKLSPVNDECLYIYVFRVKQRLQLFIRRKTQWIPLTVMSDEQ